MTAQTYEKPLTANDTGATGGHQAGVHIPKSQKDLIALLPPLDASVKNPDAWLEFADDDGEVWNFRYVYYNNKLHDPEGTRDEYRVTHMTGYFRAQVASSGDILALSGSPGSRRFRISVRKAETDDVPTRVRLRGWRRVY